jgi:DNA-binding GntR family transcriptional regulator
MTNAPVTLYRQVAEELRQDILKQRYAPGETLPTEKELCETRGISRHTAREALRILSEDGLIERRRGAGTVVANWTAPLFAQTLGDFDSILQYARETRFELDDCRRAAAETLDRFGLTADFTLFTGLRAAPPAPAQAITRILVRTDLAPSPQIVRELDGAFSEWMEREHGISIERVTQRMEAVALGRQDARRLATTAGQPALRTVRRYRDGGGEIILLSESLHPAGRFAYEMRLDRSRPR